MPNGHIEFENLPSLGAMKISKIMTSEGGIRYRVVASGRTLVIAPAQNPGNTITVVGDGLDTASNILGGLLGKITDGVAGAIGGLVKVINELGCTPTANTTIEFDKDGKVSEVTTSASCLKI